MSSLKGLDPSARAALERAIADSGLPAEWNDRLKTITDRLVSELPYVGLIVGLLVNQLWPDSQKNIWELVKDQVQAAIDRSILLHVLDERQEDIDGLRNSMDNYLQNLDNREKGTWLITMLGKCDNLRAHFSAANTRIHTLPLAVVAAQIHVGLLRERLQHGVELGLGSNTEPWKNDLNRKITEYRSYFRSTFLEWRTWRSEKIKVTYQHQGGFAAPGDYTLVQDELYVPPDQRMSKVFFYDKSLDPEFTNILKGRIMADADAAMTAVLSPTFYFHRYSPQWESFPAAVDPNLFDMRLGPYSDATMLTDNIAAVRVGSSMWTTDVEDQPLAMATKALVRHFNSIDAMQFFYGATQGHFVGNNKGGTPREFVASSGINGVRLEYERQSILWGLQFVSGEQSSEVYGMFHNGRAKPTSEVVLDSTYKLWGAGFRIGGGPSKTTGMRTLKLRFRHKDYLAEHQIRSADAHGKVLDVPHFSSENGLEIILHPPNGGANQRWSRIYAGDDLWILMSSASGKVLSLNEQTGKIVQQPYSDGSKNQRWRFQTGAGGNWLIISDANGRALTASSSLNVEPVSESERRAQLWKLS